MDTSESAGPARVEVDEAARRTADELAAIVDRVAASLPFGSDPAGFLATLDRLAAEDETP